MENYIKTVLYAYPLLKNVGEDYAEHIRNKAILSYNSNKTTFELAEYLAEEILHKNALVRLKSIIEDNLSKLSDLEQELLAIRYFGKKRKSQRSPFPPNKGVEGVDPRFWSERKYFRFLQRLSDKMAAMLVVGGVTKSFFENELEKIDIIEKIHRFVEEGRDRKVAADERRWMGSCSASN